MNNIVKYTLVDTYYAIMGNIPLQTCRKKLLTRHPQDGRWAKYPGEESNDTDPKSTEQRDGRKPSYARSSATMSASVRARMLQPSCVNSQPGLPHHTRFTPTTLW